LGGGVSFCLSFFCLGRVCSELYSRSAIRESKRISNPGCYATNTQLLLAPLLPYIDSAPTVFGVSGYSGAGTSSGQNPKVPPETLAGGIRPYSLTDHIHEREAGHHLSRLAGGRDVTVAFVPTVAPWFQGIISTVSVPLNKELRASDVRQLFQEKYEGEKLVEVVAGVPEIKDIAGKNGFKAGGFQMHSSGKRVVLVVRRWNFFSLTTAGHEEC
jgi:N-acetyl-gamma-glutamyl-phosphate reductase/acetylglutamate kinase